MAQNLISASLTEQDVAEVTQSLNTVKTKLHFLSTLQKSDVKSLVKVGNAYYLPFLDKIHQVVETHPEILSAVFDKEEFLKDYELFNQLRPIYNLVNELAEGIQKTFTAVGSDTLVASLDVYAAVKQNKDKVPGLSVTNEELAAFFKKAKAQTNDQK
jgi:hypothetical protein